MILFYILNQLVKYLKEIIIDSIVSGNLEIFFDLNESIQKDYLFWSN